MNGEGIELTLRILAYGANLFALRTPKARIGIERWRAVEQDRKKGWRVLLQMGLPLFFGAVLRVKTGKTTADAFADVMPEDLLKFGMIPEFVGRLPVITSVHSIAG